MSINRSTLLSLFIKGLLSIIICFPAQLLSYSINVHNIYCIYLFMRHPHTVPLWLIISWNTVLVAWLPGSSIVNYSDCSSLTSARMIHYTTSPSPTPFLLLHPYTFFKSSLEFLFNEIPDLGYLPFIALKQNCNKTRKTYLIPLKWSLIHVHDKKKCYILIWSPEGKKKFIYSFIFVWYIFL